MPSLSKSINVISRCANTYRADALCGSGINACHYFYIFQVCNFPGISQDGLAKNLYINKSSVTRALSSLEENGFVERRQSESDKRTTLVYPTKKALTALPFVKMTASCWNEFLLSCLDEDEKKSIASIMEKITKQAQSYIDDGMTAEDILK